MNALMLANALEVSDKHPELINVNNRAAAELRRLHAVNTDLLEALQMMFASIHPYRDDGAPTIPDKTIEKANAAISKATGETK